MMSLFVSVLLLSLSFVDSAVVFVGSTPCEAPARQFIGVAPDVACERISWKLALSAAGSGPFSLDAVYGMQANSAPGFTNGGTSVRLRGTVTLAAGQRRTYRLAVDGRSIELAQIDSNLVHVLDTDGSLMTGNPGWSYTLSRTPANVAPGVKTFQPDEQGRRTVPGVYEGRTPCEALEVDLGRRRNPECTKAKWRLTFGPSGYVLEGFGYRNPPRTGTWSVLRDAADPRTVVVHLDPEHAQRFLRFRVMDKLLLFLDKNGHPLAGDEYQSYTLNKLR